MTTFSIDATSKRAVPANAAEWANFLSLVGLSAHSAPSDLWLMQDVPNASSAADAIGGISLAASGGAFSTPLSGWSRVGWANATDGTNNRLISTSASLPDPTTTSAMLLAYIAIQSTPAASRQVMLACGNASSVFANVTTNPFPQLTDVSNVGTGTHALDTNVHPWIVKYDHTNSVSKFYNDLETVSATFAAGSGKALSFGFGANNAPAMWIGYAALFTGSNAEWSDADIATLISSLASPPILQYRNIVPSPSFAIPPNLPIGFDIVNGPTISLVVPIVTVNPNVAGELAYDWSNPNPVNNGPAPGSALNAGPGTFSAAYAQHSSVVAITGGYRFSLRRQNGWTMPPSLHVFATDALGNVGVL